MKKQDKKQEEVFAPYAKAVVELPQKKSLARCIVLSLDDGKPVVYVLPDHAALKAFPTIHIEKVFENQDAFSKAGKQTILAYHEECFGAEPPKKQDIEISALMVWSYWVKNAKPLLPDTSVNPETGKVERKSSLGSRIYTLGETSDEALIKTPQAKTCYRILVESLVDGKVTEEVLKANIYKRVEEIKTKQDAWRIFQYYRPTLINTKHIRHD